MIKKLLTTFIIITISLTYISCNRTKTEPKDIPSDAPVTHKSIYTGEDISTNSEPSLPFMVMIENSSESRPQSGLSQADVLYETSAEGGIPRFIALFQSKSPEKIGPVRSVRPYFIEIADEFDLPIAHCGGSEEALKILEKNDSITSINEIAQENYFWRDNSRKSPHNLYTSSDKIREFISDKSILNKNWQSSRSFFKFDKDYFLSENLKKTNTCKITINKSYNTSYTYKDGLYAKSMDGKESIDYLTKSPLTFSNIIIQKTDINLNPDKIHLDIDLSGQGEGYLLSQGKIVNIEWSKSSAKTKLEDSNGNEIKLAPGKTIWHIVDKKTQIDL